MTIVNKIYDLNATHQELTGKRLKSLVIREEYEKYLKAELKNFGGFRKGASIILDGIEISFRRPEKVEPSYMWGKEVGEALKKAGIYV